MKPCDLGLAAGDDDLKELGDDRVDVVVERAERGDEFGGWLGAEEAEGSNRLVSERSFEKGEKDSLDENGDEAIEVGLRVELSC